MSVLSEMTMQLYPYASKHYGYKVETGDDCLFITLTYLELNEAKAEISIPIDEVDAVVQALLMVKLNAEAANRAWEDARR